MEEKPKYKLECMLKTFVEGLKEKNPKYQRCYDCQGTDRTLYCYAEPKPKDYLGEEK